jgi:putative tricarboxylic transport membrane protein
MAELQMRRALQISSGEVTALYATSLSKVLYLVLILVIVGPLVWNFKKKFANKK